MYIFRDYHERIDRFICSRSRKAFVTAWVLLVATLALLGAVFFWMGAPPFNNNAARDTPMFLDGGWRVLNGQAPHKDFYSYFGDLLFYVSWLGMKLGRPGFAALTCGNVFVMAPAGLAAMTVLRRRTSAFYACLFSLFIAMLAVTPRELGEPHDLTNYAEIYNRYGEAFLALLGATLFLSPIPESKEGWGDWVEAGFVGFCLPLLLFCKLNYFVVGAGFFALACLMGLLPVKRALFSLLSAVAFFTLALILTKIPFSAMWGDYRLMVAAPAQSLGARLPRLVYQGSKSVFFLPILLMLGWEISRKQDEPWSAWPHFFLIGVIFGSEILLVASNAQTGELPLLALAALYGAETIRRQPRSLAEGSFFMAVRSSGAGLLFLFFLLPTLGADLKTMRYCIRITARNQRITSETLRSTRLNDFYFDINGSQSLEMKNYIDTLDEGVQLLRRHQSPQMRLAVFMGSNPFNVALGLPPAEGGVICWSAIGISQRSHPPLKRMVGNATHILTGYMRGEYIDAGFGIWECRAPYGAEWDALHLEVVEQTKDFTLFKVPEGAANKP